MKTIISILLFYCLLSAYGQVEYFGCGTHSSQFSESTKNCVESSPDFTNYYSLKETHIPDNPNTIVKTLHVNINIWQRSDGTGNLIDNPETRARIKQIAIWINNIYQYISQPSNPVPYNYEFLGDSKIRIILDSIYFYRDPSPDSAYYYGGYGNVTYGHNKLLDAYLRNNFPDRTRALNIHLTGSQWPGVGGYSDYGSIESFYHHNPEMSTSDVHDFWFANHWAHEIGHAFDLWHTYDVAWSQNYNQNYFDFLWDLYDTTLHCPVSSSFICLLPSGNNNLMGGSTISHMSALQMGIIHRSTVLENFHNTDFNIRDHVTGYSSEPYLVSNDEVWDFSMKFYQNVIVTTGHTLTIKCETEFVPNTKLIVEPGATLVLDGGKLTNEHYYNHFWQGIELQGNRDLSQLTPGAQGQVILKNGAVIENAMDGITTIGKVENPENWDWSKTGGIIKAENSTFRNCRRGIQFLTYNNVHPTLGTSLPNLSIIRNCTFETTKDLPDGIRPYAFISMNEVNGVKLYGNTFQNTNPSANLLSLGMGIYSINASYLVDQICLSPTIPCSNAQKSRFINLHYGIRSSSTPGLKAVTVKNTVFDLCHFGVYFSGMEYPTVINNDFIVDDYTFHMLTNEYAYGLYLNQCNGFQVEGNDFMSPTSGNRGWTGIYVNNSNTGNGANSSNLIYRNTFTDLYSGIVALNNNKGPATSDGLKFNCETFNGNTYDISVLPKSNPNIGISAVQGYYVNGSNDAKTLSRNWYSATCAGDENQFKIDWYSSEDPTEAPIEYPIMHANYSGAHWQPECYDSYLQTFPPSNPLTFSPSDCPDRTILNPIAIRTELQAVSTKKDELNNLIDGGQTTLLVSIAQSNIPDGQMLQTMLEFSPYLSDEVLLTLIERPNALSPGTMQQILAANSPLSDEVYQAVQAMQTPLPKGIRNQIAALQTGEMSDRDQLPYGIAYYEYTEKVLESDLVRYYLNDTLTVNPMDSVMNILEQATTKNSKLNLVSAYISSRHFAKANQTLDSLVNIDADLVSYSEKQRMNILTADLPGKELSLLSDSSKMQVLQSIANDTLQYGAVYAKNTLELLNDTLFAELTLIPMPEIDNRSMIAYSFGNQPEIEKGLITCYPNPAGEKFTAHYEVESACTEMFLVIHNIMGKEVSRIRVNECIGDVELSSPAESGTYYVYIESCGQYIAIDKIVVTR